MERTFSVKRIIIFLLSAWALEQGLAAGTSNHEQVVLVTILNELPKLTRTELRAAFLGIPVNKNGVNLYPIINQSDTHTFSAFLQQLMAMSERNYQRQLEMRLFQEGRQLSRHTILEDLFNELHSRPGSITFMPREQASRFKDLNIVQILW
jgi:hypothetical protein